MAEDHPAQGMKCTITGVGQLFGQGSGMQIDKEALPEKITDRTSGHGGQDLLETAAGADLNRATLDLFTVPIQEAQDGGIGLPAHADPVEIAIEETRALILPVSQGIVAEDLT